MPNPASKSQSPSIYARFLAEREEILRLKWLESERAGHDIGFEQALTTWTLQSRAAWREQQQAEQTR